MNRYILIDCNNFFVSCERVFNPKLIKKPVVILSSNDACVISRSNEAKALGIPMGVPAYQYEAFFTKHNVSVYSSNFTLYGDMSNRVMQVITSLSTDIEIYSVDEAFIAIPLHEPDFIKFKETEDYYTKYCRFIKSEIQKQTGIPVSIGIGPTKTLAKIANKFAKKESSLGGVFDISNIGETKIDNILRELKAKDIWGIGSRYAKLLERHNIFTAYDFKKSPQDWVRKNMTIVGLRTLLEINGISCLSLNHSNNFDNKKSICVSRSFGKPITQLSTLKEALSCYAQKAVEKLREQNNTTAYLTVFTMYSHHYDYKRFYDSKSIAWDNNTAYTPDIIKYANSCLEKIFRDFVNYKKVGIILNNFASNTNVQIQAFNNIAVPTLFKQNKLVTAIDNINRKVKPNAVFFASSGTKYKWAEWATKQCRKSKLFTTNWHDILEVNCNK